MKTCSVDIEAALEKFNIAFGIQEYRSPLHIPPAVVALRNNLLEEEIKELFVAFKKLDILDLQPDDDALTEVADALGDIIYIAVGTLRIYLPVVSPISYTIRDEGVFPPQADKAVEEVYTLVVDFYAKKLGETRGFHPTLVETPHNLVRIIAQCNYIAYLLCIPIASVFNEIHRSNMAKVHPDGTIKRREDGKILKPDGWTPPELSPLIVAWYNQLFEEHEADKADA